MNINEHIVKLLTEMAQAIDELTEEGDSRRYLAEAGRQTVVRLQVTQMKAAGQQWIAEAMGGNVVPINRKVKS